MRFIQTGEYWLLSAWQKNLTDDHFRPDCVSPFGVNDYIKKRKKLDIHNNAWRKKVPSGCILFQCYYNYFQFFSSRLFNDEV